MGPGCFGWGGPWGFPWMMIIAATIVFCMVFLFRRSRRSWRDCCGSGDRLPEAPLEILKRRYAAGEITREEFERMKQDIA